MKQNLTRDDLIRVAKRENNTKRRYLYVNPLQGKHVPVSPSDALNLFGMLAEKVRQRYSGQRLLIIGFAETATAIGGAVAFAAGAKYLLTTTREEIPGMHYLTFSEAHSHATQQLLAAEGLEKCLQETDWVLFLEDEVTTGSTILQLVEAMEQAYPWYQGGFGIASLLNSMSQDRLDLFARRSIPLDWLFSLPAGYRAEEADQYTYEPLLEDKYAPQNGLPQIQQMDLPWNARCVCPVEEALQRCRQLVEQILQQASLKTADSYPRPCPCRILVLGTEECMLPGLLLGRELERQYPETEVRFHATTRSPIEVSLDPKYPLHSRFALRSLYDPARKTFLYNLTAYDAVLILTDAGTPSPEGLSDLVGALEHVGNRSITVINWGNCRDAQQLFRK